MSTSVEDRRDDDARVAELVMGYVLAWAPCGDGLTRTEQFGAPTMDEADRMIREAYAKHVERGMKLWPAQYCGPSYTSDADADLSVLCKVRETWDADTARIFTRALVALWQARLEYDHLPLLARYVVGDYSRAALATLDHGPTAGDKEGA